LDKVNKKILAVEISEVKKYSSEVLHSLQSLLRQLTTADIIFSKAELEKILHSGNTGLLIARDPSASGKIIGTLSYAFFRVPTGLNFRIEDVVVDWEARGRGVGRELMVEAIKKAKEIQADKIDLTSSPSREAANKLYQSMGFKLKKTNVYRYDP
jgi:ribosomal protein S18 acetylase RimI-like enzyme